MRLFLISIITLCAIAQADEKAIDEMQPALDTFDSNQSSTEAPTGFMPNIITPDALKSGIYGGIGLSSSYLDLSNSQYKNSNKMLNMLVIAGYNYNKYIALETRAKVSAAYDNGVDVTGLSIFLKPQYNINDDFALYTLIGYGKTKAKSVNSKEIDSSISAAQLGAGVQYNLGSNFKVFADYLYEGKNDNAKVNNIKSLMKSSAISSGITYDF